MLSPLMNHQAERSLADQAYDFLGEMLLKAETDAMLQEIEAEKTTGDTAEMEAFFARQDRKNLKRIQKHFRKQHHRRLLTQTLPRIAQAAAVIILVVALAGGVAVATSHSVRVHVMNLLYEIDEEYSTLRIVEDEDASFDVPAQWKGSCYPSYIPEGWEVFNILSFSIYNTAEYQDSNSQKLVLRFSEYKSNIETNVDTENAVVRKIGIRDAEGILVEKEHQVSIYWCNGMYYYMLVVNDQNPDEAIRIANSVIPIK